MCYDIATYPGPIPPTPVRTFPRDFVNLKAFSPISKPPFSKAPGLCFLSFQYSFFISFGSQSLVESEFPNSSRLQLFHTPAHSSKIAITSSPLFTNGACPAFTSLIFHSTPLFCVNVSWKGGGSALSSRHRTKPKRPVKSGSDQATGGEGESNETMECGRRRET